MAQIDSLLFKQYLHFVTAGQGSFGVPAVVVAEATGPRLIGLFDIAVVAQDISSTKFQSFTVLTYVCVTVVAAVRVL